MGLTGSHRDRPQNSLDADIVQRLCQEAYACGLEDGSMAAQASAESTCRQVMYGAGLFALCTVWFSFTWAASRTRSATASVQVMKAECAALRSALEKAQLSSRTTARQ